MNNMDLTRIIAHPETLSLDGIVALAKSLDAARKRIVDIEAKPRSKLVPLNLALDLDDGRRLIVKSGGGPKLIARQKVPGPALTVGETVKTVPGKDGRKAVMRVTGHKGKDYVFTILGSEGPEKNLGEQPTAVRGTDVGHNDKAV